MAVWKSKLTHKVKFGISGGRHAKKRRAKKNTFTYSAHTPQKSTLRLRLIRKKIVNKYRYKRYSRIFTRYRNTSRETYKIEKEGNAKSLKFKFVKQQKPLQQNGYRVIQLDKLQEQMNALMCHASKCNSALELLKSGENAILIERELRTCGLASVLGIYRCKGCNDLVRFETSPKIKSDEPSQSYPYDVNVRAVWGTATSGNGNAQLSEILSCLDSPYLSQPAYTAIEEHIGSWWSQALLNELKAAGDEEREIAISKGNFHEGVPCITVIANGGWCKRSHKHSYNALGGVGVIIGKETGKILHIGVRNKYCYICSQGESKKLIPKPHQCFKNWTLSSQAMEADIIVEGFKSAEKTHGVRFTEFVGDGDSNVFARIQEEVPVWGRAVKKIECANHACKCLRSNLENLVKEKSHYKGKNKLTKNTRIRIVSAVRCAIRMRSKETDKSAATKKLAHDIKNSIHHIFGNHSHCSDFCKASREIRDKEGSNEQQPNNADPESLNEIFDYQSSLWKAGSAIEDQEEARCSSDLQPTDLDKTILRDVSILLNRIASKSDRLVGNYTTNLAECWMHMRAKFDGGKIYNRCFKGSWNTRCYGASLRLNIGPTWSPFIWEKTTHTDPGFFFHKYAEDRKAQLSFTTISKSMPESKQRRFKRKMASCAQSTSKHARLSYGPEAQDITPDKTSEEIEILKKQYLATNIDLSSSELLQIEKKTIEQSQSSEWKIERKKRLTASNFGSIVKRNPKVKIQPIVKRLLYSNFRGTQATRRGLAEEDDTLEEYVLKKADSGKTVTVVKSGLMISNEYKFLAGSPDGIVSENGIKGLIEVKNLLLNKRINLTNASKKEKNFCLKTDENGNLHLNRKHDYYYQCQGLLGVTKMPWLDFVVRTVKPYQLHIERIWPDQTFWHQTMVPKQEAFYNEVILPELCDPRNGKQPGIREPGIWFEVKKVKGPEKDIKQRKSKPRKKNEGKNKRDKRKNPDTLV